MTTVTQPQTGIWQEPKFLILLSSAFFAAFGAKIYSLALPLLVYELTASSEWMGWMRAVEYLPNLLLALFIGVWVDRVNRKHWSQAMLIGQCLCLLIAYTAVEWLAEPLWALFPAAFMMMAFRLRLPQCAAWHDENSAAASIAKYGNRTFQHHVQLS